MVGSQRCFGQQQIDVVSLFNTTAVLSSVVDPGLQESAVAAANATVLLLTSLRTDISRPEWSPWVLNTDRERAPDRSTEFCI